MRLFAAIDLTADARAAIVAEQRRLVAAIGGRPQRLRVVRPEHLHLTLVFAGQVVDTLGAAIVEAMSEDIAQAAFALTFGGAGTFPPDGRPRILWLGVSRGAHEAIELQQRVANRFQAVGIEGERRPFQPHLTLARWRDTPSRSAGRRAKAADDGRRADRRRALESAQQVATIAVEGVTLYESRLSSEGPAYDRLAYAHLRCQSSP